MPGDEDRGYSQSLLGVDGEWRGIEIGALPREQEIIDFDPDIETHRNGRTNRPSAASAHRPSPNHFGPDDAEDGIAETLEFE
jgi:hypothetical protein